MANENLKRDANRVTTVAGVTDDVSLDITQLRVDPTTKRLKVLQSALDSGIDTVATDTIKYTTLIDEVSSTVTYIGKADVGSATSASVWQIMKISVSGTITNFAWASGVTTFTKKWDDRATYTYS